MLFGDLPFKAAGLFQLKKVFKSMSKYHPPQKIKISKDSTNVLERMLDKNVNKRISAQELFKHKLFNDIRKNPFLQPQSQSIH